MENLVIWKWIAQGLLSAVPLVGSLIWWLIKENANNIKKANEKIDNLIEQINKCCNQLQEQCSDLKTFIDSNSDINTTLIEIKMLLSKFDDIQDELQILKRIIDHAEEMRYLHEYKQDK